MEQAQLGVAKEEAKEEEKNEARFLYSKTKGIIGRERPVIRLQKKRKRA